MTAPLSPSLASSPEKAITLALSLAQAEKAIHEFTDGQVDAIVDSDGRAYLLRPAQEHLQHDETRLRTILDSVGDGITVIDRGGLIVSQNRAATRMLSYEMGELVGLSFFDFVDSGELHRLYSAFFNVIEDFHADAVVTFHLRANDGSYHPIEATVSKLREIGTTCVVLTCRDMSRHWPTPEKAINRSIPPTPSL